MNKMKSVSDNKRKLSVTNSSTNYFIKRVDETIISIGKRTITDKELVSFLNDVKKHLVKTKDITEEKQSSIATEESMIEYMFYYSQHGFRLNESCSGCSDDQHFN